MSACEPLTANVTDGVASALRAVDCLSNEVAANAFGRLFATNGALAPALTILLTIYVALFAMSLLLGRSRLGVAMLNKRAMTLGLVLTFATSWIAYQGIAWNLAVGAPDYLAGVLTGSSGSATALFGERIDVLFNAIAVTAGGAAPQMGAAQTAAVGAFSPGNLIWISALMLLLGTVGALVTARIALAVMLALGPVFIVLALFEGTRGLFVGWLRGVLMTALAPLFVVLGGGLMLELAIPIIVEMQGQQGVDGRAAIALFLVASVHVALMMMVFRVLGKIVGAWSVFGWTSSAGNEGGRSRNSGHSLDNYQASTSPQFNQMPQSRTRALITATQGAALPGASTGRSDDRRTHITGHAMAVAMPGPGGPLPTPRTSRANGVGSRYRRAPSSHRRYLS